MDLAQRCLWVLDEPATALDASGVATLEQRVNAHLAAQGVAVIATHKPLALSPQPLPALISGKIAAHWMSTGFPLVAASPLLGAQFGLTTDEGWLLALGLLIGTPTLSLLGAIGAALTLGLRAGGGLLALLILPLYVPILIFGAGSIEAARAGLGASAQLSLLTAALLATLVGAPPAAAAAVR